MIILSKFSDGVSISNKSPNQLWPIFVKAHGLDCSEDDKVFMLTCFFGYTKPGVDFYLERMIKSLNHLFVNELYIEK